MNSTQNPAPSVTSIHILKYGGDFVVRPGAPVVKGGSQLRFVNLTESYAVVSFPHEEFKDVSIRIESHDEKYVTLPLAPTVGKTKGKVFPYSVYTEEGRDFCKGGSIPIIIIE